MEGVVEARRLVAQVRKDHRKPTRRLKLDRVSQRFDHLVRQYTRPIEEKDFDNLVRTAQRSIDRDDNDFESHLRKLTSRNFKILWRQDWYVMEVFKDQKSSPQFFTDEVQFKDLVTQGTHAIKNDNIDKLRQIVIRLSNIHIYIDTPSDDDLIAGINII